MKFETQSGPWTKYQQQPQDGPWTKYQPMQQRGAETPIDPRNVVWDDEPPRTPERIDPKEVVWDDEPKTSAAYREGKGALGGLQGLHSVLQGPTFGFADELYGALSAPLKTLVNGQTFAENYRESRDFARGATDAQQEQNPLLTAGTRIAASLPVGGLSKVGAAVKAPITLAGRTVRAGGVGAASGAASSLGESTAEDAGGMAWDATKGAVAGGLFNVAATPAMQAAGAVYGNVRSRFSDGAAMRHAQSKVAEALARDARGTTAQNTLAGPLEQVQTRFRKLGPEATVADAAGANTRQLLDTLATLPGRTKEATEAMIHNRQAGRAGRLISAAETSLGTSGKRMAPSMDAWIAQRKQQAAPLYQQLRRVDVTPDEDLLRVVNAADQVGATSMAKRIATAEMQKFTLNAKQPAAWSMSDLDRVKRGLDTLISKNVNPVTGEATSMGHALHGLKRELTDKLDDMTGGLYAQARAAYAGPSALMDAAKVGRTAMTKDDASIRQMVAGLQGSELEAFRLGAFESLRAKLGRQAGQTEMLSMWREPVTRERLQAMFGSEREFRRFAVVAAREARLKGLEGVGRGSQTAARMYGAGDLDVSALRDVHQAASSAASGNVAGLLSAGVGLWNRARTPEPVRDAMGGLLMSRGQAGAENLKRLQGLMSQVQQARLEREAGLGLLAVPTLSTAGGALPQ